MNFRSVLSLVGLMRTLLLFLIIFKSFLMKEREFENLKVRLKQNDHSLRQIIKSQKASGAFKKRGCIIGKHLGEKT